MNSPVYLNAIYSISALGYSSDEVWKNLQSGTPKFKWYNQQNVAVSKLSDEQNKCLDTLSYSRKRYADLDRSVLMAIAAVRGLAKQIDDLPKTCGINIGSSRGATEHFEKAHKAFITNGEVPFATSPTTTLGNIASNAAQDLGLKGPAISHSITCSSALHALLNGYAFLKSGLLSDFIVGGAEAPLTQFTIEQMKVLKLYSKLNDNYPCRSLDFNKTENTLVLGEAACLAHISSRPVEGAIRIAGIGYATEQISHSISLSAEAECLQKSMRMALQNANHDAVDVVIMHAPGTVKGDQSELEAVKHVFEELPALTTNKWQIGHTFGASGAMSLEMGVLMLKHNTFISNPFFSNESIPNDIQSVIVNAVGFGGNAVSVILEKS